MLTSDGALHFPALPFHICKLGSRGQSHSVVENEMHGTLRQQCLHHGVCVSQDRTGRSAVTNKPSSRSGLRRVCFSRATRAGARQTRPHAGRLRPTSALPCHCVPAFISSHVDVREREQRSLLTASDKERASPDAAWKPGGGTWVFREQ